MLSNARSNLTPGITRPLATAEVFKLSDGIHADAGRVHAVVRRLFHQGRYRSVRARLLKSHPDHDNSDKNNDASKYDYQQEI